MKPRFSAKLTALLRQVPVVRHLSRQKFISQFVLSLIQSRSVQFADVAQHLNDTAKVASNETRIQDFFREATLDYEQLARLLVCLLPATGKLRLCIDRTEWDFGRCQVNILLVTVGQGDFHVPLYWELLDNRSGNSSAADRIALLQACVQVLGRQRIGLVVGDQEFVGHSWLKWLKDNGLPFLMRLPKHHQLTHMDGRRRAVADLGLAVGQVRRFAQCLIDGVWGRAWVQALPGGDFLYLFGTVALAYMDQLYRKRWTIEQCFQNLKGRGFDLEASHLRCHQKVRKLVALVSLAYALCLSVGTVAEQKHRPVAHKNHGYRATSRSRHGLNILRQLCRPAQRPEPLTRFVEALLRWLYWQLVRGQTTKMVG